MGEPSELRFSDTIGRLRRLVRAKEYAAGLNPAQWEALRYFARCNRFSNRPTALVEFLGTTKGTASQTLAALERRRMIRKCRRSDGSRGIAVELTEAGRSMLARDPARLLDDAAAALPVQFGPALAELLASLQRAKGVKTFGICRTCRFFGSDRRAGGAHRCRLLDLVLSEDDSSRICVEHEPGVVAG